MNPYETLGINKNASQDDIKKAYRDLSKKYHPDKKDGDEEKFKEISQAYEILKDPNKKAQFDRFGVVGERPRVHADDALNFAFNTFFSRGSRRRRVDSDVRSAIRISLSDSIFGCEKVLKIKRVIACESCKSTGQEKTVKRTCSSCGGRGHIAINRGNSQIIVNCSNCNGEGVTYPKCEKCKGSGYFNNTEKVNVKIPKNLNSNSIIRIAGKGNITYFQDDLQVGSHYLMVDFPKIKKKVNAFLVGEEGKISKESLIKTGALLTMFAIGALKSAKAVCPENRNNGHYDHCNKITFQRKYGETVATGQHQNVDYSNNHSSHSSHGSHVANY